ncbi:hypothetical protein HA402_011437 [Bradysia odoriphaga]|uniref:Odorant-binding protein 20 n=1 Tax=Bradysia odoriphaga TaxID=1564500 RepID=A0A2S0X9H4_9DIPT|nr:odorant-binding protein 20 [Bradysia odoriphaga]KAG4076091.1 hypothetical protein HA402_011437 [Bradysia odoriphaga]
MNFHCKIFILTNVLWLTAARRTDKWPPQIIVDTYGHALAQVRNCQEEYNIDARTIIEFEDSSDLNDLPNDRSLKCFLLCTYNAFKLVVPDSTKLQVVELLGAISKMEYDDRTSYLKMTSGCKLRSKDLCEAVYQLNVCMKKNNNDYYYLVDGSDYWIQRLQASSSHNSNDTLVTETASPSER